MKKIVIYEHTYLLEEAVELRWNYNLAAYSLIDSHKMVIFHDTKRTNSLDLPSDKVIFYDYKPSTFPSSKVKGRKPLSPGPGLTLSGGASLQGRAEFWNSVSNEAAKGAADGRDGRASGLPGVFQKTDRVVERICFQLCDMLGNFEKAV